MRGVLNATDQHGVSTVGAGNGKVIEERPEKPIARSAFDNDLVGGCFEHILMVRAGGVRWPPTPVNLTRVRQQPPPSWQSAALANAVGPPV